MTHLQSYKVENSSISIEKQSVVLKLPLFLCFIIIANSYRSIYINQSLLRIYYLPNSF